MQIEELFSSGFGFGTVVAIIVVAVFAWLLVRPHKESTTLTMKGKSIGA